MKGVPCRNGHWDVESLRQVLLNLHEAEHVRNFRFRVVVDEEVEITVGPREANSPGAEDRSRAERRRTSSGLRSARLGSWGA
jgi:hypothetical protein